MSYEVRIFPNGRAVFFPSEYLEEAIEQNKEILLTCNALSGGHTIAIGADYIDGDGYMKYNYSLNNETLNAEDLQKFHKIIFTSGEPIYMKSGKQANDHFNGCLIDTSDWREGDNFIRLDGYDLRTIIDEKRTVLNIGDKEKVQCLIDKGILSKNAIKYIKE